MTYVTSGPSEMGCRVVPLQIDDFLEQALFDEVRVERAGGNAHPNQSGIPSNQPVQEKSPGFPDEIIGLRVFLTYSWFR